MAVDNEDRFECHAFARMNKQGQVQIPANVRQALGWNDQTRLMVFANESEQCVMLTLKPLDDRLLALAREAGLSAPNDR